MSTPTVTLTAYTLGFEFPAADEALFDTWIAYVRDRIEAAYGFKVEVDSHDFASRNAGGSEDTISGATEEHEAAIRLTLEVLWEEGCADNFGRPRAAALPQIQVLTFSTMPELATEGWDPNGCSGDDYTTPRARALYAALGVPLDDDEYTLAAHLDGRWALIGLTVSGHRFAIEAPKAAL